ARGRALRGRRQTLHAAPEKIRALASQGPGRAGHHQVAAQRVRPPDAAAARRHEVGPGLPEERAPGNLRLPAGLRLGVLLGPDLALGDVGAVHDGVHGAAV
nr:hypothetical protein [Tanacetum cinerariifolium]